MTAAVLTIEGLSLLILWLGLWKYRQIHRKLHRLLEDLQPDGSAVPHRDRNGLMWTYGVSTALLIIVTTALYFWQPHFL